MCHWANHINRKKSGCSQCKSMLDDPATPSLPSMIFSVIWNHGAEPSPTYPPDRRDSRSYTHQQLIEVALQAINQFHLDSEYLPVEEECVYTSLDNIMSLPVTTISHVPTSCRPLLPQIQIGT